MIKLSLSPTEVTVLQKWTDRVLGPTLPCNLVQIVVANDIAERLSGQKRKGNAYRLRWVRKEIRRRGIVRTISWYPELGSYTLVNLLGPNTDFRYFERIFTEIGETFRLRPNDRELPGYARRKGAAKRKIKNIAVKVLAIAAIFPSSYELPISLLLKQYGVPEH